LGKAKENGEGWDLVKILELIIPALSTFSIPTPF
jgi:hypothetical protein